MSLALDMGNWWECSGDELCTMSLGRSNFIPQGDKYDRRGGNQALAMNIFFTIKDDNFLL